MPRFSTKNILFIIIGVAIFFVARIIFVQIRAMTHRFTPHAVSYTLQPPAGALSATLDHLTGAVKKEGRTDDSFQDIHQPTTLLEGESVATDSTSSAVITFPNIVTIAMQKNSQIDYVNGLPKAVVIRQPVGDVTYTTDTAIQPFSIRTLALLVQWTNTAHFLIKTTPTTVTVSVTQGALTLAYSDNNNDTKVAKLATRQRAIFNNDKSTLTVY